MKEKISVFVKEPGRLPRLQTVRNTLEALQTVVGGYIETLTLATDLVIVCNEEGRLQGLPYNCELCGAELYGTIILAGVAGEDFADFPNAGGALVLLKAMRGIVEWHRPADKLPEDGVCVLAQVTAAAKNLCFVDALQIAEYVAEEGAWIIDGYPEVTNVRVTWWTELPEPPIGEEADA